jgi:hypothetical protein
MKKLALLVLLLFAGNSQAYDGLSSELSHLVGGGLLAGVVTRSFQESEHRAWIGFAASSAVIVLTEQRNFAKPDRRHGAQLDVTWHVLGAALGAWSTDKYLLTPFVSPKHVGFVWTRQY